jgi:hypothetical protein
MAEGEIEVDMPWQIEGPRAYQLAAGQRQRFTVVFAPDTAGLFRREIRYTSHRDRTTLLRGEVRAAIAVDPAAVELRHGPGDPARHAVFHILNHTSEDQTVTLGAAERLQAPASITVPAGERVPVSLSTAPTDVAPLGEEVRLAGAGMELRVPVRAAAVAPILRSAAAEIDFGQAAAAQPARASLEIQNVGGTEGFWRLEPAAPVSAEPAEARLAPGEKKKIGLTLLSPEPGQFRSLLTLRGEGQAVALPFKALVTTPSPPRRPATRAGVRALQTSSLAAGSRSGPLDDRAMADTSTQRPGRPLARDVAGVRPVEIGRSRAVLEWPASLSPAKEFRIESRQLSLDAKRDLKIEWTEESAVRTRFEGGRVRAQISNLKPGSGYMFRVVPLGVGSGPGKPLFSMSLQTAPKLRLRDIVTLPRVLAGLLVICLSVLGWQKYLARP